MAIDGEGSDARRAGRTSNRRGFAATFAAVVLGVVAGCGLEDTAAPAALVAEADVADPMRPAVMDDGRVATPPGRSLLSVRLSPDGKRVAFEVGDPVAERIRLWIAELDGTSVTRLENASRTHGWPDGAPGGRLVSGPAWSRVGPVEYAYSVPRESPAIELAIAPLEPIRGATNLMPHWDPTGPRLVFTSFRTGHGDLYLWDAAAPEQVVQITEGPDPDLFPTFDPTGARIGFQRALADSDDRILLWDRATGTERRLAQGRAAGRPTFSPDGQRVAYALGEGDRGPYFFALWTVAADDSGTRRRLASRVRMNRDRGFSWTPAGDALVAVVEAPLGGDCVAWVPVDDGEPACLELGTQDNRDPHLVAVDDGALLAWISSHGEGGHALNLTRLPRH